MKGTEKKWKAQKNKKEEKKKPRLEALFYFLNGLCG